MTMTIGQVFKALTERHVATASFSANGSADRRVRCGLRPSKRARSTPALYSNESTQELESTPANISGGDGTLRPGKLYLRNWRFHERNPHMLSDYTVPALFSLDFAVEAGLIAPNSFTWLYIVCTTVAFSFNTIAPLTGAQFFRTGRGRFQHSDTYRCYEYIGMDVRAKWAEALANGGGGWLGKMFLRGRRRQSRAG